MPFEERDARLFYGRDGLADRLVRRLAERLDGAGILLVAGESGSGKSSLLRAGLLPRLAAGALGPGSERWPRRVIRPTASPLRELAMGLAEMAGGIRCRYTGRWRRRRVRRRCWPSRRRGPSGAVRIRDRTAQLCRGRYATAAGSGGRPVRGVVHRGRGRRRPAERRAFVTALHAAATFPAGPRGVPAALVVAVVRADYLGRLIAFPPLKAALDAGLFTVGPMSEAELRLAVTGPAVEAGLVVEPAVVEAVIAELHEKAGGGLGSGVLPLMSQAMAATWERREGNELTLRGYRRAAGSPTRSTAARRPPNALTTLQRDAARLVFTQLITADGHFARRRCRRADLSSPGTQMAADIDAVIDVFSARRLLVLGENRVEIAHDALLQAWKQLRDWLADGQLDRVVYRPGRRAGRSPRWTLGVVLLDVGVEQQQRHPADLGDPDLRGEDHVAASVTLTLT